MANRPIALGRLQKRRGYADESRHQVRAGQKANEQQRRRHDREPQPASAGNQIGTPCPDRLRGSRKRQHQRQQRDQSSAGSGEGRPDWSSQAMPRTRCRQRSATRRHASVEQRNRHRTSRAPRARQRPGCRPGSAGSTTASTSARTVRWRSNRPRLGGHGRAEKLDRRRGRARTRMTSIIIRNRPAAAPRMPRSSAMMPMPVTDHTISAGRSSSLAIVGLPVAGERGRKLTS